MDSKDADVSVSPSDGDEGLSASGSKVRVPRLRLKMTALDTVHHQARLVLSAPLFQ